MVTQRPQNKGFSPPFDIFSPLVKATFQQFGTFLLMLMLLTRIPFPFTLCPRQLLTTHREEKDEDKIPKIPNMENYRGEIHQSRYMQFMDGMSQDILEGNHLFFLEKGI